MKISCPKCNASGNIPDHEIPEAGRFVSCPRCKEGFTVKKPRSGADVFMVDTCPACNFSTFGDETFGTCPKCGVVIKTVMERKREEKLQKHNQELLVKKFNRDDVPPPPPPTATAATAVADFVDNLHPANLIGWGVAAAAVIIVGMGFFGLSDYDSAAIQKKLTEQREEQVSGMYVFLHYGMIYWIEVIYGITTGLVSVLFMKRLRVSLKALSGVIWAAIVYVPVSYIISFVFWMQAPIPHETSGYLIEVFNIVFMSALVGIPLFILERYLSERTITSVVKL